MHFDGNYSGSSRQWCSSMRVQNQERVERGVMGCLEWQMQLAQNFSSFSDLRCCVPFSWRWDTRLTCRNLWHGRNACVSTSMGELRCFPNTWGLLYWSIVRDGAVRRRPRIWRLIWLLLNLALLTSTVFLCITFRTLVFWSIKWVLTMPISLEGVCGN